MEVQQNSFIDQSLIAEISDKSGNFSDTDEFLYTQNEHKLQNLFMGQPCKETNGCELNKNVIVYQNNGQNFEATLYQKIKSKQKSALSLIIIHQNKPLLKEKGKFKQSQLKQELIESKSKIVSLKKNNYLSLPIISSLAEKDKSLSHCKKCGNISFNINDVVGTQAQQNEKVLRKQSNSFRDMQKVFGNSKNSYQIKNLASSLPDYKLLNPLMIDKTLKQNSERKIQLCQCLKMKVQASLRNQKGKSRYKISINQANSLNPSEKSKSPKFEQSSISFSKQNNFFENLKKVSSQKKVDQNGKSPKLLFPKVQTEYLNMKELSHNHKQSFSNLLITGKGCEDSAMIQKYQIVSDKPTTLIFEPVGTLFLLLDSADQHEGWLSDPKIKVIQVYDATANVYQTILIKVDRQSLFENLKRFKLNFELILYTFLPQKFVKHIFEIMPELYQIFDHVLTKEDAFVDKDCIVRDISIFIDGTRTCESICVIDCDSKSCDEQSVFSLTISPYQGEEHSNLIQLYEYFM